MLMIQTVKFGKVMEGTHSLLKNKKYLKLEMQISNIKLIQIQGHLSFSGK